MSESALPESRSTEDELFEAMDRQALRFIEMLNDESLDADGNDKVDIQLKMKLFAMGQDWLIRRKKLRPISADETEGEGVRDMREWINNPEARTALEQAMFEAGFVKAPVKKNGRPTKSEAAVRERFQAYKETKGAESAKNDDSGLAAMLAVGGDE